MNRLSFQLHPKKPYIRDRSLLVDGRPLLEILEEAIPSDSSETKWIEKDDAMVDAKALKRTLRSNGEFQVLTCRECGMPEDLTLEPFVVMRVGDEVVWQLTPPGAGVFYDRYEPIEFRFDRVQYEETVRQFLHRSD